MSTKRTVQTKKPDLTERQALRRRVQQFCRRFNKGAWEECYALIDPQLTGRGKVNLDTYSELMQSFKNVYGSVKPRWTDLSLHLEAMPKQRDKRPFAYVYVLWQDEAYGFHMFRERWILDDGQWFTRVVGLIPNRQETDSRRAG
ncbi:MAG: hypothetical protein WD738_04225 [Pirellulales bacterium]